MNRTSEQYEQPPTFSVVDYLKITQIHEKWIKKKKTKTVTWCSPIGKDGGLFN